MDADRFDAVLRTLSVMPSRRVAVRLLTGLGLASLLGRDETAAKRRRKKKHKKPPPSPPSPPPPPDCPGQQVCGATCIATTECCGGCGALTCCTGVCTDLATSGANCGACGHTCATNACIHGTCDCQGVNGNCPAPCTCGARKEGGTVCFNGGSGPACTTDADCPLRSSCLVNNLCSGPCLL